MPGKGRPESGVQRILRLRRRPEPEPSREESRVAVARPPAPEEFAVVVEDLKKTYKGGTEALKGVGFRVRRGEFYGILGPNGAGKSTAIGILGTLVQKTSGTVRVLGLDVDTHRKDIRRRIGFALQEAGVDDLATGLEFLTLQGRLYGLPMEKTRKRAEDLLLLFGLKEAGHRRIKTYSGGMRRRIDLASALIHQPPLLFLDEPTEGLDPRSRAQLWTTLERLNKVLGTTVLLTTHYMEEADRLCDRIAIIDQGRIIVEGTPDQLKASLGGQNVVLTYSPETPTERLAAAEAALRKNGETSEVRRVGTDLIVQVADGSSAAPALLRTLDRARVPPAALAIKQPTLDDVYLRYTGRTIAAAEVNK